MKRRDIMAATLACSVVPAAWSTPESMAAAVRAFAGGTPVLPNPKVRLDVSPLVENGNAVPVSVSVDHPVEGADAVIAIALFNERNPQHDVGVFTLSPASGRAFAATRIRLATSQKLVALAKLADGRCWSHTVSVEVTLAACIE